MEKINQKCIVWGTCFLWVASLLGIIWSLLLFFICTGIVSVLCDCYIYETKMYLCHWYIFVSPQKPYNLYHSIITPYKCSVLIFGYIDAKEFRRSFLDGVGDMLMLTGMDVVVALILLSGIIMFPTNVFMLHAIANGQKLSYKSRVLCCPLWMLIVWIIIINTVGFILCMQKICMTNTYEYIENSMKNYRTFPRYKRFMDNLQWTFKCCGLDSFKDWFNYDWYEKNRDYEWDPSQTKFKRSSKKDLSVPDSVPLSCCKSGTCVPNYLLELGTHSIHTRGCNHNLHCIYIAVMNFHLAIFLTIIIIEIIILSCIMVKWCVDKDEPQSPTMKEEIYNVKHLMSVNNNFLGSSSSASMCVDDEYMEESEISN